MIKQANLNVTLKQFFRQWLNITQSFHNLTDKEKDVLSLLLYYNNYYKTKLVSPKLVSKLLFDYDTKMQIIEELQMKDVNYRMYLTKLRQKGIIVDNKIVSTYVPEIKDQKKYRVVFNFNIV